LLASWPFPLSGTSTSENGWDSEEGLLERFVEGSNRTRERRAENCRAVVACAALLGGACLYVDVLIPSMLGTKGGGSMGIVLRVLVLVTRRNVGPVGILTPGDCLVGDGGGSEF